MESVHPLIVHFPIALLLTAVGIDALALLLARPHWHRVALWNLVLGACGAATAVLTGRQAAAIAKHSFEIHQVMERHERLGYLTLALSVGVAVWRLFRRDRLSPRARAALLLVMLGMMATLVLGAHLGGRLVYEFGVGMTSTY